MKFTRADLNTICIACNEAEENLASLIDAHLTHWDKHNQRYTVSKENRKFIDGCKRRLRRINKLRNKIQEELQ